jgi:GNAT superfamily N-acetyltransferase
LDDLFFRPATAADGAVLREFLRLAIFVPPGADAPPPDTVDRPELARYVEGWGRPGDAGILCADATHVLGAAWCRRWPEGDRGYGYLDGATPELAMAVRDGHRGRGIGTALLQRLIAAAGPRLSLSVGRDNPAAHLYARLGFRIVRGDQRSVTMLRADR